MTREQPEARRVASAIAAVIGGLALLDVLLLLGCPLNLFPDEAYYWDWSRHLDWAYVSKGPAVALILAVSTRLLGDTELAVRLPAVVLGALTGAVLVGLAWRRGSVRAVPFALVAVALVPLLFVGRLFMTTDPPFALCWAIALFAFSEALDAAEEGRATGGWLAVGDLFLALGTLCKPTMLLLLAPLALVLARRRLLKVWLRRGWAWAAVAVAGGLVAPMVAWNAQRGWPTVEHVAGQAGVGGWAFGLPELVGTQLLLLTPWLAVFVVLTSLDGVRRPASAGCEFLAWSCLLLLAFFAAKSLQGEVEANWPLPAWLAGLPVAAMSWARRPGWRRLWRRWHAWACAFALLGLAAFLALPLSYHVSANPLWYQIDPTRRAAGFDQLGARLGVWREALAAERGVAAARLPVGGLRYQDAAVAAFYTPGRPRTFVVPFAGRPETAYDFWASRQPAAGETVLVLLRREPAPPAPATERGRWTLLERVELRVGKQVLDRYTLWRLDGYRPAEERW